MASPQAVVAEGAAAAVTGAVAIRGPEGTTQKSPPATCL